MILLFRFGKKGEKNDDILRCSPKSACMRDSMYNIINRSVDLIKLLLQISFIKTQRTNRANITQKKCFKCPTKKQCVLYIHIHNFLLISFYFHYFFSCMFKFIILYFAALATLASE